MTAEPPRRSRRGETVGAPVSSYDVTVTWMDGKQESYAAESAFVENGVLKISPLERYGAVRYVPLATMRIFTVNPQ